MPLHMKTTDMMENTMKIWLTLLLRYSRWRATKFHPTSWDVMTVRVHHPLRLGRAHGWLIVWTTFHSKGKRKLNSTLKIGKTRSRWLENSIQIYLAPEIKKRRPAISEPRSQRAKEAEKSGLLGAALSKLKNTSFERG